MMCNRLVLLKLSDGKSIRNVMGAFFVDTAEGSKDKKMLALIGLKTGFAKYFRGTESHGGIL